ncbi:MAG: Crp/Fnr family transcriptional regulator [Truepera sp.]|jgi:CRP/FNR family transcriptional regulator|nr:Crp/Fnr family transcriptional regulator [Truepera sp.]
MPSSRDFLRQVALFSDLEPTALEVLTRGAARRAYDANEVVFSEGATSEGLYIVEDGWLKGSKLAESGREQVLRYFGEGEAVNEVSLFVETTNPATLTALEPSHVWLVPRQAILVLAAEQPSFLWPLTQALARRLHYVVGLVEDLSLFPLEARVAKFLLEHSEDAVLERRRWATQAELAARLGTVPDVLHRVLRNLSEAGLIEVERQQILILDPAGLEARTRAG